MDYDVNNQPMLSAGAYYSQSQSAQGQGWQPMSSAPRDGTIVEIRCVYGVAPWFGLYRWTDTARGVDQDGKIFEFKTEQGWRGVSSPTSFTEDNSFSWRPYAGAAGSYVDPTGGAQNSTAYWRGAVAAKYGLPLDAFEETTRRNGEIEHKPKTFWQRLIGQ